MASGHADRATINLRKPMTEGMREMLRTLIIHDTNGVHWGDITPAGKNRMRALMDRGYASPGDDNWWHVTLAGRQALRDAA